MVSGVPISEYTYQTYGMGYDNYISNVARSHLWRVCADLRGRAVTETRAGAWLLHTGPAPRYTLHSASREPHR